MIFDDNRKFKDAMCAFIDARACDGPRHGFMLEAMEICDEYAIFMDREKLCRQICMLCYSRNQAAAKRVVGVITDRSLSQWGAIFAMMVSAALLIGAAAGFVLLVVWASG